VSWVAIIAGILIIRRRRARDDYERTAEIHPGTFGNASPSLIRVDYIKIITSYETLGRFKVRVGLFVGTFESGPDVN